ncbi:MAG: OmpA family protein [Alphaproteobacteria bacterium]
MKKILALFGIMAVAACTNIANYQESEHYSTPTVDYVERLDVKTSTQADSFLTQLAMNYRSYAIFNARQARYPDLGEMFAQKAIVAFSGETPMPESIDNWNIQDKNLGFELSRGCQELVKFLKNDMSDYCPIEAAEAQAKFDCWISASATGQMATANECRSRFYGVIEVLRNGGPNGCGTKKIESKPARTVRAPAESEYYPEPVPIIPRQMRARDGIVVVNNIKVDPVPVPLVFTQNIYGGDKSVVSYGDEVISTKTAEEQTIAPDIVSRQEFIEMMQVMREEIRSINDRLDKSQKEDITVLKVQQIPLEPKQHIMEEVFEVYFDFNKAVIKPEYAEVIKKLAKTTQENRNVKVSVVGHTDTKGSQDYNFALGGRRAKAVRNMLVKYGIPSEQIVIVSSGENDLKVQTKDNVRKAENRRARVIKEERYIEQPKQGSELEVIVGQEAEIVK